MFRTRFRRQQSEARKSCASPMEGGSASPSTATRKGSRCSPSTARRARASCSRSPTPRRANGDCGSWHPSAQGYGLSDFRLQSSLAEAASDLEHCADALGLHRFALIGVSGGGPLCGCRGGRHAAPDRAACPHQPGRSDCRVRSPHPHLEGPLPDLQPAWLLRCGLHRFLLAAAEARAILRRGSPIARSSCVCPASDRMVLARDEVRQPSGGLARRVEARHRRRAAGFAPVLRQLAAFASRLDVPTILWQGSDDAIVPPGAAYDLAGDPAQLPARRDPGRRPLLDLLRLRARARRGEGRAQRPRAPRERLVSEPCPGLRNLQQRPP